MHPATLRWVNSAMNVTVGQRLRQIRYARSKSLQVVAGLAGMSKSHLSRLERGECALDRQSEIVALASALQISPSELTRLPIPAPGDGRTDTAIRAVRGALMAVAHGRPGGQVLPVEVLRARVETLMSAHYRCDRDDKVSAALPELIHDLHSSIAAGRDVAELSELAVVLHSGATLGWLRFAGAPLDLRSQVAMLAREVAQDCGTPVVMGLAVWGGLYVLVTAGAFDLALAELDSVRVPMTRPESMQVVGMLALCRSFLAAAGGRPGDVDAPLDHAAELAERTGQGNSYWMGFGPQEVGQWQARTALEIGDYERAAAIAEGLRPKSHPLRGRQALYWVNYGQALTRIRGRRDDAVLALRRAERISPHHVHHHPGARETLSELLMRAKHNAVGRELRGMAYRAGLLA
ncbi:MAG: helix-turn-helix domain-containing protein [Actinomycetota bacterium]|nr:helix-turn-helix domain-containing protein [Actinomycetota bacterium]